MTEHDHEEIARRLRDTGTIPAPDRLRDDVMSQVRTEPRLRSARRPFLPRLLPYAAAAAALAVAVLAISHLGGGSGASSSGAGASGGGVAHLPEASRNGAAGALRGAPARDKAMFSLAPYAAQTIARDPRVAATRTPGAIVLTVPRSLFADYKARLRRIERSTPGGPTIRVVLRRLP